MKCKKCGKAGAIPRGEKKCAECIAKSDYMLESLGIIFTALVSISICLAICWRAFDCDGEITWGGFYYQCTMTQQTGDSHGSTESEAN